ncbi:P-loop containing nucleoside triphosphate hydrolase protein [Lophium mytilinum]|uniref:P-loop containing nucleoside triphosphate hydrolase protein n=1 Tax=Lophium mytilinum TaxID=390894 RepID=A0A6A6RGD3_9PEZI|nr:P-loop containing nucleoside triphosphate hydrolase protein [Lophium mytilinum]
MARFRSKPKASPLPATAMTDPAMEAKVAEEAVKETSEGKEDEKLKGKKDGEDEKAKASLKNFFRVLTYGTTLDWVLMGLSLLTSIGSGIAMPLMNIVFGQLTGTFTGYFIPGSTVTKAEFQSNINKNTLYIVYLFIGKFACSYVSMLTVRISGLRISAALRLAYLNALFQQPVSTIDTISPGKVSTRITTSSNTIQLAISQQLAMLVQAFAFTGGLYVIAFIYNWLLTFVASASLPFIVVAYGIIIPIFIRIHKRTESLQEQASGLAFEIFSSIRVICAFGAESRLSEQHAGWLTKAKKSELKNGPFMGLLMAPNFLAMYGTFGLTFWFGIRQYTRGHIDSINTIVIVLFSVMMAVMSIGKLTSPLLSISRAASAATELFATIDAEVPDTSGLSDPDVSADTDIEFDNVSFVYPSRPDVQILDHLNLHFAVGKTTAIVGPSGSGKSTIVALLERWYPLVERQPDLASQDQTDSSGKSDIPATDGDKTAETPNVSIQVEEERKVLEEKCVGAIRVGGVALSTVDLKWWRSQIGLVQQEPFLFNDTIYNNIAYGFCGTKWEHKPKEEKLEMIKDACKEASADEFISKLPLGYDTFVGESGIKMSGGQRQRLAIARSIVKRPPILILDEATSAIDVRTERVVQEALDRVSKNRTTIVIAHRLSTIRRADKIIVLRQGKLVEEGTHDELVTDEEGIYYGLVHAQNLEMENEEAIEEDLELHHTKTGATDISEKHADLSEGRQSLDSGDEPVYKYHGLIRSFGRLIYEQRTRWIPYTLTVFAAMASGAVYPLQAFIFAKIINVFTYTGAKLVHDGNFWSGMFGVLAAGVGASYFILGWASHIISSEVSTHYRQEYLENMITKRMPFFDVEGHSAGSLTSRLSNDSTQLEQLMGTEMSMALISVFNLTGSIAISFAFGWKLSLVGLFSALPIILGAGYLRVSQEMKFEKMNAAVFEDSSQFATEAVGAFRTVMSLIMEDTISKRYSTLLEGHVTKAFSQAKYSTVIFAGSDSIELACMALCFWYGGTLLAAREYNIVQYFIIYMAVVQGSQAAGVWFSFAPNMAEATGAANRILSIRPAPPGKDDKKPQPFNKSEGPVGIEFRNVYFTYKGRDVPVITGLNLKIEPGQFAALVGASGCGKSTTISLLERFYDPDSGSIICGDQDTSSVDIKEYRSALSLVAQEPTLYEGTLRENVALSVDVASATDEAIEQACTDAQIHDFILSLPEGYATKLGPKGMSLSGGQKQRIALARALLRRPKVLLLDEATSSLDSESEKQVQAAIERAAGGGARTVIAVAHRLATIQKADVIFVLGSGRVLEQGDHQSLLKKRGVYYQMCQAQALDR